MNILGNRRVLVLGSQQIAIDVIDFIQSVSFCGADDDGYVFPYLIGVVASDSDKDKGLYGQTVSEYCFENNIPCFNGKISTEMVKNLSPDIIFSVYYRNLLPKDIIEIPNMGCINLHPSLLPYDRGPAPVYWAIRNGNKFTGTTLHYIDSGMDTGDIIDLVRIKINEKTGFDLNVELMNKGLDLFSRNYFDIMRKVNNRKKQDDNIATCNIMFNDEMRYVDWSKSALEICNHIKAHTYPYAGSMTHYKGQKITLWNAEELKISRSGKGPGWFEGNENGIIIQTHTKPIKVTEYLTEYELPAKGRFV